MTIYKNFYFLCANLNFLLRTRKLKVVVPFSKFNVLFLKKLQVLGFVHSYSVSFKKKSYSLNGNSLIIIDLFFKETFILPFQGISVLCPSKKLSNEVLSYNQLLRQRITPGVLILSTRFGLLTRLEALEKKTGGVPVARIW